MLGTPFNIRRYLDLNELLDRRHAAIHKILKSHPDLDMEPFFQWKLKLLPAVINWFQSARSRMVANDLIGDQSKGKGKVSRVENFQLYTNSSEGCPP